MVLGSTVSIESFWQSCELGQEEICVTGVRFAGAWSSHVRRLYLLALIDATKHPQIHGHPTICQTALQIAPVLTKEMMATPTISLAMMSLMQNLAKDDSPDMGAPRAALLKRLEEMASQDWLAVLREATGR